ncbi:hypothetical protein [Streptomyces albidoflavus]|nr:hypothetical protein [Streptomyces albidoflavus]
MDKTTIYPPSYTTGQSLSCPSGRVQSCELPCSVADARVAAESYTHLSA